mmetsp:Transcript_34071/g.75101  ORF Transcript_34071/g.75101 Transcript_34071/m.75101 type:complete len:92 (-) Transcript_34071:323-598(-)
MQVLGITAGPQIIVGWGMGAWIAVLLALIVPERVKGLVLHSPALDFTTRLLPPLSEAQASQLQSECLTWATARSRIALRQPWMPASCCRTL